MSARGLRPPFVFICYRRDDTSGYAGRLHDALAGRFGAGEVFMDMEAIPPGADFVQQVEAAIAGCLALLPLIGPRWLSATSESGARRLDDPEDFVRVEIEAALRREIRLIPVLVQGAKMPRADQLPASLRALATLNALELSDTHWQADVRDLGDALASLRHQAVPATTAARPRSDAPIPAGPEAPPVLYGRESELDRIGAAFAEAALGEPRLLIVTGEAGVGKTGLTHAAAVQARAAGGRVLRGACLDIGEGGLPYLPIAQALRGLARSTSIAELDRLLGTARDDLAAIAPELDDDGPVLERGGGTESAAAPSGSGQARLFERFIGLLDRVSADRPSLLVIEDVQWVDRATRDLLTFVVRNLTSERLVTLLTCRPDDLPLGHPVLAWLNDLGRTPGAERLELGRLKRGAVDQMLGNLLGGPVEADLAARVWRRSDGNPLFVEEVLAAELAGPSGPQRPMSLVETLVARLSGLTATTRRFVDVISVVGRPVGEEPMAALVVPETVDLVPALREAIAQGVLVPDPGTDGYRFRHELVREVVERELLPSERRAYHLRVAELLQAHPEMGHRSPADATAELASHWIAAGRVVEAHRASIAAAAAAEAVHAFAEAHAYLERAIDLESRLPSGAGATPAERLDLRRRAAEVADLSGDFTRAIELNREALTLVDPELDPATAGMIHGRLGYQIWVTGDAEAAIAEHHEAVRLVPAEPPSVDRAHVLGGLGGALFAIGRWADSRTICEAAIACAVAVGSGAEECRARNMLGSDLVSLGEVAAGIDELRLARKLAEGAGRPDLLILSHHNLAVNLVQADRFDEALSEAQAGRAAARQVGLERRFGQDLAAVAADALLRLGRWRRPTRSRWRDSLLPSPVR